MQENYYVYVLRCADGSLYTGYTANLESRLARHQLGRGAKYTRSRLPVILLAFWTAQERSAAMRLESRIKRLRRSGKLAVLSGVSQIVMDDVVVHPYCLPHACRDIMTRSASVAAIGGHAATPAKE